MNANEKKLMENFWKTFLFKKMAQNRKTRMSTGAPARTRTGDTWIRNPLLYPFLSYGGVSFTMID
jgi:hypothetical protein